MGRHYYKDTDAVIFVVDSNDRERIDNESGMYESMPASEELHSMLQDDELRNAVLLVLANKQDLPNAMSVNEVTERLSLNSLRNRKWYIQGSCATSGDGVYQGLDWLSDTLAKVSKGKQHVAQWIERQIPILKVKGSIPFMLI